MLRLTRRELETWPRWNCEPTRHIERVGLETLHLPCARQFSTLPALSSEPHAIRLNRVQRPTNHRHERLTRIQRVLLGERNFSALTPAAHNGRESALQTPIAFRGH